MNLVAFKAEIVLAVQLVTRHRAFRLAALLVLVLTTALASGGPRTLHGRHGLIVAMAGVLACVAGSRLLAPGGALTALRMAAGPWWLAPVGRLMGAWIVVYPLTLVPGVVLLAPQSSPRLALQAAVTVAAYAASAIGCTAALTPVIGASSAAAIGFLAAWAGTLPPSGVHALLEGIPALQGPLVLLWNVAPLPWRASGWFAQGRASDGGVLLAWCVLAVLAAAWTAERFYRAERTSEESGRWL